MVGFGLFERKIRRVPSPKCPSVRVNFGLTGKLLSCGFASNALEGYNLT